ncbi:type 2 lantipeptide synthetase LanM [Pseudenhygromyxa sp. WMMC2535]|nr:type 2 lantipeptide synthetase LanM [Pseudenhygromyxa sp. WMMC2535]
MNGEPRWRASEAASLSERLAGLVEPVPQQEASSEARAPDHGEALWQSWRSLVAGEHEDRWAKRIADTGRSPAQLRALLGPVRPASTEPLPWAEAATRVLESYAREAPRGRPAALDFEVPIPFAELLAPIAAAASERLRAQLGERVALLSPLAWTQLERQLLWRLSEVSDPTLSLEFTIFRARARSSVERLLQLASNPGSTALYERFVALHRGQGLMGIAERYAALPRCWGRLVEDWIASNRALLEQLEADAPALADMLGIAGALPPVEALQADMSDRHHGGRTVGILSFGGDHQIVYKPRDVAIEARWAGLLEWLRARGAPVSLRGLRVLARPGHGWVEFARATPCASVDEFADFYRRAGALLCLVHLLAGNDCHRENLIAVGADPVLVDVETLMHPAWAPEHADDDAWTRLGRRISHSVIGTSLLPHWSPVPAGGGYESGGIGPGGSLRTTIEARVPQRRNTDEAGREALRVELPPQRNVPYVEGAAGERFARAEEHVEALVAGFEATARFLLAQREALLAKQGPLRAFGEVPVRVLLRGTPVYEHARQRSLVPEAMRSGAGRSIALDSMARPLGNPSISAEERVAGWTMVEAELAALEGLDIPRFELRADADARCWQVDWTCSGFELSLGRVAALSEANIAEQVGFIRGSFDARDAVRPAPAPQGAAPVGKGKGHEHEHEHEHSHGHGHAHEHEHEQARAASDEQLRRAAAQITARVKELATRGADGSATWLSVDVSEGSSAFRLYPMAASLYSGVAGVALYLAAASVMLDDAEARDLALAALRPARPSMGSASETSLIPSNLGGVMGLASTAYGLAWTGRLLEDEALLDDAVAVLGRIDQASIEADRHYDLSSGAAGAILVLLEVHGLRPEQDFLALARRCGEQLLAARTGEPRSWPIPSGQRLSGLAHGASGTAWALHRLAAETGEARFAAAAREALAFERTLYHPAQGNWEDVRPDVPAGGPSFMHAWCNGAPGIGMVRLRIPADEPHRGEELMAALQTTARHGFGSLDHFCCGNVGRAEFLLDAGRSLGEAALVERAREIAGAMCERAEARGAWALARRPHRSSEHAGLFRGLSGIGWHFLRQLEPARLPSLGLLASSP